MKRICIFILFFIIKLNIFSQISGDIDTAFNPNDIGFSYGDGVNNNINTIAIQNDGKSIIGGSFTTFNGIPTAYVARINTDGRIDGTFNLGGVGTNNTVLSSAIQADGKILIGGFFTKYNNDTTCKRLMRLNTDGTVDTTFHIRKGLNDGVNAIAIQTDGKILIGGFFNKYDTVTVNYIARLDTNGSLDTTYTVGAEANNFLRSITLQSDGKAIIGGDFTSYNGVSINSLVRLNTDGSIDGTFITGTGLNSNVVSSAIQPDGKILIAGFFTTYNGISSNYLARLNSNGTIDGTFNVGSGANSAVVSVLLQPDGKILMGGYFSTYNGLPSYRIARLNSNGTIDNTFSVGRGAAGNIYCMMLQNDGKILLGGTFSSYDGSVAKYFTRIEGSGQIDNTYKLYGTGANDVVQKITFDSNNRILIGGQFTIYNDTLVNHLTRLNPNGSIDTTFHIGSAFNNNVTGILLQNDGKIIASGGFTIFNGVSTNHIIRLNPNGSVDNSFSIGSGADNYIYKTALQSDGKIIITGGFSSYNGVVANKIARLNSDGSLDLTFNSGSGPNSLDVQSLVIQPDGKILISANFTSYNGIAISRFARLNSDGSLDNTFVTGTGPNTEIQSMKLQPDGKILISGNFNFYNGSFAKCIARINSNGSFDPTFTVGLGANSTVTSIVLQSDGKIFIAGCFSTYNSVNAKQIALLNSNGTLNTLFNSGTGIGASCINSMEMQVDGKLIIGGGFGNYNTIGRNRIARIFGLCVFSNTTASNLIKCSGDSAILSAISSGVINWYASPTSTVSLGTGNAFNTPVLSAGTYTYFAEGNTCATATRAAISVTVNALPTLTVTGTNTVCLGTSTGFIANGAMTYTWNTGQTTTSISVNPTVTTTYTVLGSDMNGCINSETVSITVDNTCADVWPGDANSDGTADNLDVLELGLHYTQTGAPRATTTNNWQSYFANNWTGTITNGKNLNHSDCNGDGIINDDDTLAIYNNYGLTHTFKPAQTNTINPQLSIVPDQAMVVKGTWGTASVYFGDATSQINNINGIAFTVDFDNTLIEPNSIYIEYQNSFLDASQNLYFRKLDFANSKLFAASTHTLSNNVSGFGKIATLHYKIKSSLTTDQVLNIGLSQANQSDASGNITPLTSGTGTLMAIGASVGIQENSLGSNILISPNPTNGLLTISTGYDFEKIELTTITGQVLLSESVNTKTHQLQLQNLAEGIYFVKVSYANGMSVTRKVLKQ